MSETTNDFAPALAAGHPSADRWLAYHRGELAAGEETELQEHLAGCRDCFDLALAAADFSAEEPAAAEDDAVAARGLWRLMSERLAAPPAPRSPRRPARRPGLHLLAAALCLALLGSTAWNLVERREIATLRSARPGAPIVEFFAGERGAPEETKTLAGDTPAMLVLHPGAELSAYQLAIRDAATGRPVGSFTLGPDADLALTLSLPPRLLPPGLYRLELTGAGGFRKEWLLRVTEAGRGS